MKILLVEDDQLTSDLLTTTLSENRHVVDLATDGAIALEFAELWDYDLILLDVNLPKLDGVQVCREIRSRDDTTPILMLTAQEADEDVIAGLDAGADDYVIKPCKPEHLLARIRALLRRKTDSPASTLVWGALSLDLVSCRVTYHQQNITLRRKEYMLLELFLRYPQRVFSRSAILDHLWTVDNFPSEGAVTNLIKDLRHRLTSVGLPQDVIETVHGLGYRLKPVSQEPVPDQSLERDGKAQPDHPLSIEHLQERFQDSIQQRLLLLKDAEQMLLAGNWSEELRQRVKQEVHRLAGSLGMYGYERASDVARSLDRLLAGDIAIDQSQTAQCGQWLAELQQQLSRPPNPVSQPAPSQLNPLVLMISENDHWAEALQQAVRNWDLRVEVVPDWSPAQQQYVLDVPAAIAIESRGSRLDEHDLDVLREIKQQFPLVPVLMLAEQDDLISHVVASRVGSQRYLVKPLTPAQFFEAITQLLPQMQAAKAEQVRVLIVDDDPSIHPILTRLLQPWGLEVLSLEEPERFWQVLTQTHPDLVLLDVEMATFNGIELCRVMRQDTRYSDLPILVITAHTEPDYIQQVFDAGADDLLRKPIVDSEFVTRVINRLERSYLQRQVNRLRRQQTQQLYQQATVDALTQIANRRAFDEFLQQSWQRLQGEHSLSLILCDVDQFKLYNDRYGHLAGDRCLQQVASTLQQCIRPGIDQVARYGGEEFVLVLPDTSASGAVSVADRIQDAIAHLKIPHSEDAAYSYLSLSLGITSAVPSAGKSFTDLIAMADRALYAAKEKGRNSYCLYPL
ncbi:response regulator [Nodosilinea sp. E11]|uniref:response regulator n=1 Tax=Nodosilinea sp. E11 TaxID=3037479 RepID=UPI002934EAF5|nr:response regulator [Nodosilinea sp. E11]WOD37035.1 response regulator [Nodosilinea sp. E11]